MLICVYIKYSNLLFWKKKKSDGRLHNQKSGPFEKCLIQRSNKIRLFHGLLKNCPNLRTGQWHTYPHTTVIWVILGNH